MSGDEADETSPGVLTPYSRLDEVLTDHAHGLHDAVGETFVGLYLSGSLAIGDFDLTSDVDLIAVTEDELRDDQVERVQAAHTQTLSRDTRWVKHLEYAFFSMEKLWAKTSPYDPAGRRIDNEDRKLWYFVNGSPTITRSDHDNLIVARWTLRYRSRPVLGPEPATFAPEVTADELRREIRSSMLGWEKLVHTDPGQFDNRFHQVFMVLNNCRALQDLHEGRITSKREGMVWAKERIDPAWHPLIDYCWRERQDTGISVSQPADPEAFEQTVAFIEYTTRLAEAYRLADI